MGIVEGVAEIGRDGIAVLDTVAEEGRFPSVTGRRRIRRWLHHEPRR